MLGLTAACCANDRAFEAQPPQRCQQGLLEARQRGRVEVECRVAAPLPVSRTDRSRRPGSRNSWFPRPGSRTLRKMTDRSPFLHSRRRDSAHRGPCREMRSANAISHPGLPMNTQSYCASNCGVRCRASSTRSMFLRGSIRARDDGVRPPQLDHQPGDGRRPKDRETRLGFVQSPSPPLRGGGGRG
jgi:hypothetical protein